MPDGLNDEERVYSWLAAWEPSFAGMAIVNEDFTFRSVNPQFCEICGVTPAELIGQSFEDITAAHVRKLDAANAELVKQGKMRSYLLPKTYEFSNGRKVDIQLLVVGAYDKDGKFLHFVSRILENPPDNLKPESAAMLSLPLQGMFAGLMFAKNFWAAITVIGAIIAAMVLALGKKIPVLAELIK